MRKVLVLVAAVIFMALLLAFIRYGAGWLIKPKTAQAAAAFASRASPR